MTALRVFVSRLWGAMTLRRRDVVLTEEIQTHLDYLAEEFEAQGMPREAARRAARREFGAVALVKESTRHERGFPRLESIAQDARFALRQLRRQPGFAAAAVMTLALGIGATTGVLTVVDMALLQPLPYPDPERLVVLHERQPGRGLIPVSPADVEVWRKSATSFEKLGLLYPGGEVVTGVGEPERLAIDYVSPAVMSMLGIRAAIGRTLVDGDDIPGRDRVVVLSDEFWRSRFGTDPTVVGRSISINGLAHEIVGVLSAAPRPVEALRVYSIDFPRRTPQMWKPVALTESDLAPIGNYSYGALARLKQGVSLERARAEVAAIQANLLQTLPAKGDVQTAIVPLDDQIVVRSRDGLRLLAFAAGAVMLIGCANLVNLLLSRSLARRREMTVRQALGASRARLIRQLMVEHTVMCALGALASLLVSFAVIRFLVSNAPPDIPRLDEVAFDGGVLWLTVGASAICALLIGLLPAWRLSRAPSLQPTSSRGVVGDRDHARLRSAIVSLQVGISIGCLVASALLLQSFVRLAEVDRGFDPTDLLTVELSLASGRYADDARRVSLAATLVSTAAALPDVVSATVANRLPLTGIGANSAFSVEGSSTPITERPVADTRSVTPEYFATLGLSLRAGQIFSERDRGRAVAVISENLAALAWPGEAPIGRKFRFGSNPTGQLFEVIGVVSSARNRALNEEPTETAYVQYPLRSGPIVSLIVRTSGDRTQLTAPLRQAIRAFDTELPISAFRTMDDVADESLSLRRFQLQLVVLFTIAAALLALVGVYGLSAYAVIQRHGEFGVRLALGALPRSVLQLVLRDSLAISAIGLVAAVPIVLASTSTMRSLLYGVQAYDPATMAGVSGFVLAATMLAAFVPGRRASRIEPSAALRAE